MGVLSRVIFDPDATPPTTPGAAAASALSQTAIRITWTASTDTGGSGLAGYRVLRATTSGGTYSQFAPDLSPASLALDDTSLTAGVTRFYRVVAIDGNGNQSSPSSIASATTQSASGGNIGQVGGYANLNLSTFPVYSVNMALADYYLFATQANPFPVTGNGGLAGSGSHAHNASGWWDGGAYCRITPPTTDQYERGINLSNLHRSGSLAIQEFNLRYEILYGPTIASAYETRGQGCKHALIQFAPTLGGQGNTSGRPVFFIQVTSVADSATYRRANTLAMAPAANTLPAFGQDVYNEAHVDSGGTNTYYVNGPQGFYLVNQADAVTSFLGKPIFKCGEHLTVEYRLISVATAQYPRGLIAMRVTNRAGITVERGIPWNYQFNFAMGQFLDSVQQFGCGQFNVTLPPGPGVYFDIGGYITPARNYGGWLGPRSGFVTG